MVRRGAVPHDQGVQRLRDGVRVAAAGQTVDGQALPGGRLHHRLFGTGPQTQHRVQAGRGTRGADIGGAGREGPDQSSRRRR